MTETEIPAFDDLERGHVVLAPDPFEPEGDPTRPWVVVNNEQHPFDRQQYSYDSDNPDLARRTNPSRRRRLRPPTRSGGQFGSSALGGFGQAESDDGLYLPRQRQTTRRGCENPRGVSSMSSTEPIFASMVPKLCPRGVRPLLVVFTEKSRGASQQ
jgi:hypothetical protein